MTARRGARSANADRVLAAGLLAALAAAGCRDDGVPDTWLETAVVDATPVMPSLEGQIRVPPPPFREEGVFPCSDCHDPDIAVTRRVRELKFAHTEIVLDHAEESRWCLDCHAAEDRDHLRLANGDLVSFEESYKLCGQCHGTQYRDWRAGIHGRRIGDWDGEKQYLLCVHCHDSHAPQYAPIKPLPAPRRPERTR